MNVGETLFNAGLSESEARSKARLFDMRRTEITQPTGSEVMRWFVPGRIEVLGKHTDYGGADAACCAQRNVASALPRSRDPTRWCGSLT